jgi:acyl-homoserine-lactone acylase
MVMFSPARAENKPVSTITITEGGIPHVAANDMFGMGYGTGYAMAKIDLCAVSDAIYTYAGKRSALFGGEAKTQLYIPTRASIPNLVNDLTIRFSASDDMVDRIKPKISADVRGIMRGFAKGFNAYIKEVAPKDRPEACNEPNAIIPITEEDLIKRSLAYSMLLGQRLFLWQLYTAAPPSGPVSLNQNVSDTWFAQTVENPDTPLSVGSNAYAFGKELTENGSGILLANPHYTWEGPERFMQIHQTAPGYNVMGSIMLGMPVIGIGYNDTLAWTHTVSSDVKATLYRLTLDPQDATRYLVDGVSKPMKHQKISVDVKAENGAIVKAFHTFWVTEFGPIVEGQGIPWTEKEAYALSDPNDGNFGLFDQTVAIGRAKNVHMLKNSLEKYVAAPFLNTIAADSTGEVFYGNMAVTPSFSLDQLQGCYVSAPKAEIYFTAHIMDGSKSMCVAPMIEGAPRKGILPGMMKPSMIRSDYVANSNDSHWYTNPSQPMVGFSPLIGREGTLLNARTRLGHKQVQDHIAISKTGLFNREVLKDILFDNRNYMAEILVDDIIVHCEGHSEVSQACNVLKTWDQRDDTDSVGALLFREVLKHLKYYGPAAETFWEVPFDPTDPVNTPYGIKADNTSVIPAIKKALAVLKEANLSIYAPLGDVQFIERNGHKFPIHGGPTSSVYNAMDMTFVKGKGYTDPVISGPTILNVVGFENGHAVADSMLVTGQTTDETSSFALDGLMLYSQKKWARLPFTADEIKQSSVQAPIELFLKP